MRRSALTLIECMAVIAVIAVLVVILLPALVASKARGESLVCKANLRQHAAATLVFVQNEGRFPYGFSSSGGVSSVPPGGFIGHASDDWRGWWWFHQITDTQNPRQDASLHCPSQMRTDNLLCGHYGANYAVYKIGESTRETDFFGEGFKASHMKKPFRTVLLTDAGYALISWKATLPDEEALFENPLRRSSFYLPGLAVNARRTIAPLQQNDALKGRHHGRSVNVAFADGHVRMLNASHLAVIDDPNDGATGMNHLYLWMP